MDKKVIIFDLDDTLTESKQPLDTEMASLLASLIDQEYIIAVMSGGSLPQYKKQFLTYLSFDESHIQKLFLIPTSGAAMYRYTNNDWQEIYTCEIPHEKRVDIIKTLLEAGVAADIVPDKTYGELVEDRGSQITYSALGQNAPLGIKRTWDPDKAKRKKIIAYFSERIPEYMIHISGTTSVDVTQKGIDKTYGIQRLSEFLSIPISEMVFVGDSLYPGGNDEPAKLSGIDCISVSGVADTKNYIRSLIKDL